MTTTSTEADRGAPDASTRVEAQQAMVTSLLIAAAAETGVRTGAQAYVRNRIDRATFVSYATSMILQGMSKARMAGAYWAARDMLAREHVGSQMMARHHFPRPITEQDQTRIITALTTITEPSAPGPDGPPADEQELDTGPNGPVSTEPEVSEPDRNDRYGRAEPEVVMRSTRLAHAETISSGRTGYAEATADALGDDYEFSWRFEPSAKACGRCLALAEQTFESFEDAPADGGHPNCTCALTASVLEPRED